MSNAQLMLHCGAREVARAELALVPVPQSTKTFVPVSHERVVSTVEASLGAAGFVVKKSQFGLTRNDARMFATFDLESLLAPGVSLAVGIRNSWDKSLPMGFAAGSRVFCCDNLALRSELIVRRKHSVNGLARFNEAIADSVGQLKQFQQVEAVRTQRMQALEIDDTKAESVILRVYSQAVISHRVLPAVLKHWRDPEHEEFRPRTVWSLLNAFTSAMGPRLQSNPHAYAASTMRLFGVLDNNFAIAAPEVCNAA